MEKRLHPVWPFQEATSPLHQTAAAGQWAYPQPVRGFGTDLQQTKVVIENHSTGVFRIISATEGTNGTSGLPSINPSLPCFIPVLQLLQELQHADT